MSTSTTSTSTSTTVRSPPIQLHGHTRPVNSLVFSPLEADGLHYLLASSCKDGTPMLRDGSTGDWLGSFLGHKGCCWAVKLSANTQRAVSGSADFSAKVWDATSGECLLTLPHNHIVRAVDINSDGSRAVTGGHEKKLRVWDLEHLLALETPGDDLIKQSCTELLGADGGTAHSGNIRSVIWDEANNQIISAGEDKTVKFWDLAALTCVHTITTDGPITSMGKGHDQIGTMTLTYGNTVDFIDPKTRKPYLRHILSHPVSSASLHPRHANTFVTGSTADGWVRVHDAQSGAEREVYKGHHGPVHAISYSPDGELYASGSEDGTIRLWQDTPKTYGLWKYEGNGA